MLDHEVRPDGRHFFKDTGPRGAPLIRQGTASLFITVKGYHICERKVNRREQQLLYKKERNTGGVLFIVPNAPKRKIRGGRQHPAPQVFRNYMLSRTTDRMTIAMAHHCFLFSFSWKNRSPARATTRMHPALRTGYAMTAGTVRRARRRSRVAK